MAGATWYIVRTNPNCEKRAEASLLEAGFEVYRPTFKKEYRHFKSKRWISKRMNVFVGYLFLGMPPERPDDWGVVRRCDGVKDVLGKSRTRGDDTYVVSVPTAVVAAIMEAQASGSFDELRPLAERLKAGDRVKIDLGALAGRDGVVIAIDKDQVRVTTEMFASRVVMTVPVDLLKPAA